MAKAKNKVESVKLEFGSVRQKTPGGTYYFRYQINGIRKEIPLHTTSKEDAIWFLSQQDEFERLKELAEDTIDRLEEEEKEEEEEEDYGW